LIPPVYRSESMQNKIAKKNKEIVEKYPMAKL
jgi:hypothetical protein